MTLPRASGVMTKMQAGGTVDDTVTLDYEGRFLRRRRLSTDGGAAILVDLPQATGLDEGDVLVCDTGLRVAVLAAPEPLIAVTGDLPRLAWHIGNRHTPCQIEGGHSGGQPSAGRLLIRDDHVLADMLSRLGAGVERITAPFRPEGGAYGQGRTFGHSHGPADHVHMHESGRAGDPGDGHAHASDHGHAHAHAHAAAQGHGHAHTHAAAHEHAHTHAAAHAHGHGEEPAHAHGHDHDHDHDHPDRPHHDHG